jgi:hypothetical protein
VQVKVIHPSPGAPMPSGWCTACGQFLPHWCAATVTITQPKAGPRIVTITDRTAA